MVESHDLIFNFGPVSLAVVWLREVEVGDNLTLKETSNNTQKKLSRGLKYVSRT